MTIVLSAFVIVALACALPGWALLVRRLHDADLSGWLSLLTVLPYAARFCRSSSGRCPRSKWATGSTAADDQRRCASSGFTTIA